MRESYAQRLLLSGYTRLAGWCSGTLVERIQPLRNSHRGIMRWLHPERIRRDGFELYLDATDSLRLTFSDSALAPARFLAGQLQPGQTVIDVGAHIGLFTIVLAQCIGPCGRIVAIEPDPGNFRLLQRNITLNGCSHAEAVNAAVADTSGTADLHLSSNCSALHRLQASSLCNASIRVPLVTLDELWMPERGPIHLIKLDIEGSELKALHGMTRLLDSNPEVRLFLEFGPCWLAEAGCDPRELIEFLVVRGFRVIQVEDGGRQPLSDPFDLLRRYPIKSGRTTNLYCLPSGA